MKQLSRNSFSCEKFLFSSDAMLSTFLERFSIKTKLVILSVFSLLALAMIVFIGLATNTLIKGNANNVKRLSKEAEQLTAVELASTNLLLAAMDNIVDKDDGRVYPDRIKLIKTSIQTMRDGEDVLQKVANELGMDFYPIVRDYSASVDALEKVIVIDLSAAIEQHADEAVFSKFDNIIDKAGAEIGGVLTNLRTAALLRLNKNVNSNIAVTISATRISLLVAGIAIVLLFGGQYFITRSIIYPLGQLQKRMLSLASGETETAVPGLSGKDELSAMAEAVEVFRQGVIERERIALEKQQLILANIEVKEKAAAAQAANKAKSEFLAMMSHELRTPMNAILGSAQLLRSSELDPEQDEHVKTLLDGGEILMAVLNDVLDFSKIEAGKLDICPIDTDVTHLVRKLERLWSPKADETGIKLICTIADDVPAWIKVDGTRLRQVLYNLLSNAVKFTEEGEVRLTVTMVEKTGNTARLHFAVSDTGIGVSEEAQGRLFTAFEQAESSTTRRFGGTGLGLAISRKLTQLMGGDISIQSQEGVGSTFTVGITAPVVAQVTRLSETEKREARQVLPNRKLTLLAAEDNAMNRKVLAAFLKPLNAELIFAIDGEEALNLLQSQVFDVVLMDIQMPKMDGMDVVKTLRNHGGPNQSVPVLAMTANAMQGDRASYLAAGMNDYIAKPIDPRQLMTAIVNAATIKRNPQVNILNEDWVCRKKSTAPIS